LQRLYEDLRPSGLAASTVVANVFRKAALDEGLALDDFQVEPEPGTSTAGGEVAYDAEGVEEDSLGDGDARLSWSPSDPMNGMTWTVTAQDRDRGMVFEWADGQEAFVEWEVPEGQGDWSELSVLSFRACQGSRHPNTVALDGSLSFSVTLLDGAGVESTVDFGAWGGLSSPYKRTGLGGGQGWANEFNTVRLPLSAFDTDGVALDLSEITAVRFELGGPFGSAMGRVGIDDLEVTP